ncbi:MAG: GNAT family N-acetyltransferase [Ramlibacter sp.]|nr:GNAT family N-acetyltransferase [Ramlibacter sp.]
MTLPIEFETSRLILRQWRDSDREAYAALNADPVVMEHFPSIQTSAQSDVGVAVFSDQLATRGWGNWACELKATREFIGFVGLTVPRRVFAFSPCVEVGWRLAHRYWGQGYATEAASASLAVGFERIGLNEIVSMTALANRRSQAVMERIGMANANEDFDHPGVPVGSTVRRHCLYRLDRDKWLKARR